MRTRTKLPYEPVERYLQRTLHDNDPCTEQDTQVRALGTSWTTIGRWRRNGVPLLAADHIAVRLGEHPSAFWPNWFDLT